MKKFYYSSLLALITFFFSHAVFSQQPGKYRLGSTQDFYQKIKRQISTSSAARGASALKLNVSAQESLSLLVNTRRTEAQGEYLVGEVEKAKGSSFFIRINGSALEGNIVLKDQMKAYQYSSDRQGNAYIESVDINKVLCVNYEKAPATTVQPSNGAVAYALTNLESFPGARGCVLLDYDGHYVSGTPWNGGNPINAAHSGMTDAMIQESWEIVSEDFRPFHLNVTTNEAVFNSYPRNRRMRCIITPTNTAAPGAGGVAYIGSFNWNDDTPCWVFVLSAKGSAEAASHEVGHTFGLGHDGRTSPAEGYYQGHGNWAPIMGVGYYRSITQWSRGEYTNANNREDDLAKISSTTYGVGYRDDDHGNATSSASVLSVVSGRASGSGIITTTGDVDYFSFTCGAGTISLNVNTVARHGNLDILARLHNSAGTVIGTYNPTGLNATISASVAAGTYYVSVDGTGAGNPASDGYSDYASLGTYTISGTVPTGGTTASTYRIKNRWQNTYLYDAGDRVRYNTTTSGNTYLWALEDIGGGQIEIRNIGTGEYMHVENLFGYVQCTPRTAGWWSSRWVREDAGGGFIRIRNVWQNTQYMHVENLQSQVQYGNLNTAWHSMQWVLEPATAAIAKQEIAFATEQSVQEQSVQYWPNQISTELHIATDGSYDQVQIVDLVSKNQINRPIKGNKEVTLDVSGLSKGIHLVKVIGRGKSYSFRVIK